MKTKLTPLEMYNIYKGRKYTNGKRTRKSNLVKGILVFVIGIVSVFIEGDITLAILTTLLAGAIIASKENIFC